MKEDKYGRNRYDSYPKHYHKEPMPMFYLTLLSSSKESGTSKSEVHDFKRKQENKSKKNEDNGAMFQCQELDGGNAIECEIKNYFSCYLNMYKTIKCNKVYIQIIFFIFRSDISIVSHRV